MKINDPVSCLKTIKPHLDFQNREAWCVVLDHFCQLLSAEKIAEGPLFPTQHCLKQALNLARVWHSKQLLLIQSRPGNIPFPYDDDICFYEKLSAHLNQLDILLADYLIVTPKYYYSFLEEQGAEEHF